MQRLQGGRVLVNRDDFLGIEDLLLVPQERTS